MKLGIVYVLPLCISSRLFFPTLLIVDLHANMSSATDGNTVFNSAEVKATVHYTKTLYGRYLQRMSAVTDGVLEPLPTPPAGFPQNLAAECDAVALCLAKAIRRQCNHRISLAMEFDSDKLSDATSWPVDQYSAAVPKQFQYSPEKEAILAAKFPPIGDRYVTREPNQLSPVVKGPAVFTDAGGVILAWYLPAIISPERWVSPSSTQST